jgi:Rrf2 family protein
MRLGLTKRTGDAIRILMHLASLPPGERRTSTQLARDCDVSAGNVPTLVAALSRAGVLASTRGPGGGCALGRDPASITIAEAVMAIEGSLTPEHCAIDERRCVDRDYACGLHESWSVMVRGLTAGLSELTLAEAVERNDKNRAGRRPPAGLLGS